MNNRKNILVVASILLLVGLALCLVSARSGSQPDFLAAGSQRTEITYEKQEYQAAVQGIETVLVRARDMPVTVLPGDGDQITIEYFTCEEDPYDVTLENGVLALKCKYDSSPFSRTTSSWFFFVSNSVNVVTHPRTEVKVYVPQGYAGDFQLDTSNAGINVSSFPAVGEVRVGTSNGNVEIEKIGAQMVDARTSNAAMTLTEVAAKRSFTAATSNGALTVRRAASGEKLQLETSNGHVAVEEIAAPAIDIRTSNAAVTGNVGGNREDYTISSSTSNASNNLNSGGSGQRRLTVETSNGAIDVRFFGD